MNANFIVPEEINDLYIDSEETLKLSELECKCCKKVMIHPKLLKAWEKLRKRVGQPIIITSGYRCWKHHVEIYKELYPDDWKEKISKQSYHLRGMALDMRALKGMTVNEFLNIVQWAGFTYAYIIDNNHVHGDVGKRDSSDLII